MEKNKVWIDDCNTPEAAAHAYDVAAFYYGKGNNALNFEHTPRFLPKTLEYSCAKENSCAKERKHAIQEQARHLRRNPLFYLIHHLPYDVLFCFVMWELHPFQGLPQTRLALLIVQLMRLVRKDSSVISFQRWVSLDEEIARLHAHTNIPQLLESIDCQIKKSLQQKQTFDSNTLNLFFYKVLSLRSNLKSRPKVNPLTLQFIEWVRINLVTAQTTSMEAKDLPASPSQCNVRSIMFVEIDLRAPQTSSMAMGAEAPLVNIPPQCNTLPMHYPLELIQDTSEQDLMIWHKFSLESQHLTYQDATPEEQVVQSPIGNLLSPNVISSMVL